VEANSPPVADAGGPYSGSVGTAIAFDGSASYDADGSPLSYAWDFGDGTTGTGVAPSHVYAAAGDYTVTLVVNDGDLDSAPSTTTATVEDEAEEVLVTVVRFSSRDIRKGVYDISATLTNDGTGQVSVVVTVLIYDSTGTTVVDPSLPAQSAVIDPAARSRFKWNDPCPLGRGAYVATITVTAGPDIVDTASETFQVK